ncbi:MAG TPA: MopE-related protein [Myxococcota bacterium]|nr:MopE-related protein [Myxococcota bacterium]
MIQIHRIARHAGLLPGICCLVLFWLAFGGCGSDTLSGPARCATDTDCAEGEGCDEGICHPTCVTSESCPSGMQCFSGFCRQPCSDDSRCGKNEVCENGFCVAGPDGDGGTDGDGDGGPDTTPNDRDGDGIPNNVEDKNGNGSVDPGETDPDDPDSDSDGVWDGIEDANHNGQLDDGETDPLNPDSDSDGIRDGLEDKNGNGLVDSGETDPRSSDSDEDGLPDGTEDANHNGQIDDGETNPAAADTDDDGLSDGVEDMNHNGQWDVWECDPNNADTDADGLPDGVEDADHDGVRDSDETDPLRPDTDGDGLPDGLEDTNHDGAVSPGETDPRNPDSDGDGIADGIEDANHDGAVNAGESDPLNADSDSDGLPDGIEDANRNGALDDGETDATNPDSDGDGLDDGIEDLNHNGQIDFGETDPLLADSDGDLLPDGTEDANGNGLRDIGETDPTDPDSDSDGIPDGYEDSNLNGLQDAGETDPSRADSDSDGLSDGQEDCNGNFQYDAGQETNPLDADTDDDGVMDGDEDRNGDCILGSCTTACQSDGDCGAGESCAPAPVSVCVSAACSQGETSPQTGDSDGDGLPDNQEGTYLVCSTENLKPVDLYRGWDPDFLLALEIFFTTYSELSAGGAAVGAAFYSPGNEVAGFLVSHPPAAGVSSASQQEANDRGVLTGIGTVGSPSTRALTSFDGYGAILAEYTLTVSSRAPTQLANDVAGAFNAGGALSGALGSQGTAATTFHLFTETIYRGAGRVVTVGALSTDSLFSEAQTIRLNDVSNSTAVAQAPDRTKVQCDSFATAGVNPVDFIWVVDNSGSMDVEQAAVAAAGNAMESLLSQTTLDWRIGVTTTYSGDNGNLRSPGFTTDINTFKNLIQVGAGGSGTGYEWGLQMGVNAINNSLPCTQAPQAYKFRCDATRIVVVLSDEDDQTIENASGGEDYGGAPDAATVTSFINQYTNADVTLFAIVGGDPLCSTAYNSSKGYNAVVNGMSGGSLGSICDADQTNNVQDIVRAAQGIASSYLLTQPPISSTIKVAMQTTAGQPPLLVPRSRSDGFDYDGTQNSLVFYGSWRPQEDNLDVTASYRSYDECVPEAEICDGIDNDCNGEIDEIDGDSDGWGLCQGDCDDSDPNVHPGATEECNGIDDNCNGFIDEGFDADNDGWTTCGGDCNDNDPTIHPEANEYCNGIDDDCDGQTDEGFDTDGDGWTTCGGDCDDNDPDVNPGAEEVCDCMDNDCDGLVDEGFDTDGDGWTTCGDCQDQFDCDDNDDTVYPGAPELCDGKDNDCDGEIDPAWACG